MISLGYRSTTHSPTNIIGVGLTGLDEVLGDGCLGSDEEEHAVGQAEDLVCLGLIQLHGAGVRAVEKVAYPGDGRRQRGGFYHPSSAGEEAGPVLLVWMLPLAATTYLLRVSFSFCGG